MADRGVLTRMRTGFGWDVWIVTRHDFHWVTLPTLQPSTKRICNQCPATPCRLPLTLPLRSFNMYKNTAVSALKPLNVPTIFIFFWALRVSLCMKWLSLFNCNWSYFVKAFWIGWHSWTITLVDKTIVADKVRLGPQIRYFKQKFPHQMCPNLFVSKYQFKCLVTLSFRYKLQGYIFYLSGALSPLQCFETGAIYFILKRFEAQNREATGLRIVPLKPWTMQSWWCAMGHCNGFCCVTRRSELECYQLFVRTLTKKSVARMNSSGNALWLTRWERIWKETLLDNRGTVHIVHTKCVN